MLQSFREPLVAVKRQILLQDTTVERRGEPRPGKTVISCKSGRFICNSGGTVGNYTPHPVWDGGAFLFYSTKIPKSVNQSVT